MKKIWGKSIEMYSSSFFPSLKPMPEPDSSSFFKDVMVKEPAGIGIVLLIESY